MTTTTGPLLCSLDPSSPNSSSRSPPLVGLPSQHLPSALPILCVEPVDHCGSSSVERHPSASTSYLTPCSGSILVRRERSTSSATTATSSPAAPPPRVPAVVVPITPPSTSTTLTPAAAAKWRVSHGDEPMSDLTEGQAEAGEATAAAAAAAAERESDGDVLTAEEGSVSEEGIVSSYGSSAENFLRHFQLVAHIGRGSFADVTLARHRVSGEVYALKRISKQRVAMSERFHQTMTERSLLVSLHHPFLVRLHRAIQSRTHLYFLLQFGQGGDFYTFQRSSRWLRPMQTILERLQYPYYVAATAAASSPLAPSSESQRRGRRGRRHQSGNSSSSNQTDGTSGEPASLAVVATASAGAGAAAAGAAYHSPQDDSGDGGVDGASHHQEEVLLRSPPPQTTASPKRITPEEQRHRHTSSSSQRRRRGGGGRMRRHRFTPPPSSQPGDGDDVTSTSSSHTAPITAASSGGRRGLVTDSSGSSSSRSSECHDVTKGIEGSKQHGSSRTRGHAAEDGERQSDSEESSSSGAAWWTSSSAAASPAAAFLPPPLLSSSAPPPPPAAASFVPLLFGPVKQFLYLTIASLSPRRMITGLRLWLSKVVMCRLPLSTFSSPHPHSHRRHRRSPSQHLSPSDGRRRGCSSGRTDDEGEWMDDEKPVRKAALMSSEEEGSMTCVLNDLEESDTDGGSDEDDENEVDRPPTVKCFREHLLEDSAVYPDPSTLARDDEHRMPLRLIAFYAIELAMGLQHIHEHNFLYRDLKPENILMQRSGHLMLTDFGVAKSSNEAPGSSPSTAASPRPLGPSTRSSSGRDSPASSPPQHHHNRSSTGVKAAPTFTGTKHYISPEMLTQSLSSPSSGGGEGGAASPAALDVRVDYWAFGCVLFEWVTGRRAFDAINEYWVFHKIVMEDVEVRPTDFQITALELHSRVVQLHFRFSEQTWFLLQQAKKRKMARRKLKLERHAAQQQQQQQQQCGLDASQNEPQEGAEASQHAEECEDGRLLQDFGSTSSSPPPHAVEDDSDEKSGVPRMLHPTLASPSPSPPPQGHHEGAMESNEKSLHNKDDGDDDDENEDEDEACRGTSIAPTADVYFQQPITPHIRDTVLPVVLSEMEEALALLKDLILQLLQRDEARRLYGPAVLDHPFFSSPYVVSQLYYLEFIRLQRQECNEAEAEAAEMGGCGDGDPMMSFSPSPSSTLTSSPSLQATVAGAAGNDVAAALAAGDDDTQARNQHEAAPLSRTKRKSSPSTLLSSFFSSTSSSPTSPMSSVQQYRHGKPRWASRLLLSTPLSYFQSMKTVLHRPSYWRDLFMQGNVKPPFAPYFRAVDDVSCFPSAVTATGLNARHTQLQALRAHRLMQRSRQQSMSPPTSILLSSPRSAAGHQATAALAASHRSSNRAGSPGGEAVAGGGGGSGRRAHASVGFCALEADEQQQQQQQRHDLYHTTSSRELEEGNHRRDSPPVVPVDGPTSPLTEKVVKLLGKGLKEDPAATTTDPTSASASTKAAIISTPPPSPSSFSSLRQRTSDDADQQDSEVGHHHRVTLKLDAEGEHDGEDTKPPHHSTMVYDDVQGNATDGIDNEERQSLISSSAASSCCCSIDGVRITSDAHSHCFSLATPIPPSIMRSSAAVGESNVTLGTCSSAGAGESDAAAGDANTTTNTASMPNTSSSPTTSMTDTSAPCSFVYPPTYQYYQPSLSLHSMGSSPRPYAQQLKMSSSSPPFLPPSSFGVEEPFGGGTTIITHNPHNAAAAAFLPVNATAAAGGAGSRAGTPTPTLLIHTLPGVDYNLEGERVCRTARGKHSTMGRRTPQDLDNSATNSLLRGSGEADTHHHHRSSSHLHHYSHHTPMKASWRTRTPSVSGGEDGAGGGSGGQSWQRTPRYSYCSSSMSSSSSSSSSGTSPRSSSDSSIASALASKTAPTLVNSSFSNTRSTVMNASMVVLRAVGRAFRTQVKVSVLEEAEEAPLSDFASSPGTPAAGNHAPRVAVAGGSSSPLPFKRATPPTTTASGGTITATESGFAQHQTEVSCSGSGTTPPPPSPPQHYYSPQGSDERGGDSVSTYPRSAARPASAPHFPSTSSSVGDTGSGTASSPPVASAAASSSKGLKSHAKRWQQQQQQSAAMSHPSRSGNSWRGSSNNVSGSGNRMMDGDANGVDSTSASNGASYKDSAFNNRRSHHRAQPQRAEEQQDEDYGDYYQNFSFTDPALNF